MIWIVAGTKSARDLVNYLTERGMPVLATATTDYGRELLGSHENLRVLQGKLERDDMVKLIEDEDIEAVIDSSHPYAAEVKGNIVDAARQCSIPAIRFEREEVAIPNAVRFPSYEEAAEYIAKLEGNILMTIGSQKLHHFKEGKNQNIYARVLPMESSIEQCSQAGYSPGKIIAMKSVFSTSFNMALMEELDIKYMVTKESGAEGGVIEKIEAAKNLDVEIIVIERPKYNYDETLFTIEDVYEKLKSLREKK